MTTWTDERLADALAATSRALGDLQVAAIAYYEHRSYGRCVLVLDLADAADAYGARRAEVERVLAEQS